MKAGLLYVSKHCADYRFCLKTSCLYCFNLFEFSHQNTFKYNIQNTPDTHLDFQVFLPHAYPSYCVQRSLIKKKNTQDSDRHRKIIKVLHQVFHPSGESLLYICDHTWSILTFIVKFFFFSPLSFTWL